MLRYRSRIGVCEQRDYAERQQSVRPAGSALVAAALYLGRLRNVAYTLNIRHMLLSGQHKAAYFRECFIFQQCYGF